MGDRKRRRDAFFRENPKCCFCGGMTRATTEDHQPGRVFFKGRNWPEGFVFPACESCNDASRDSEQIVAVLIHGEGDADDRRKFQDLLKSVSSRHPKLVPSMLPDTREVRNLLKSGGLKKPDGVSYSDIPLVKLDTSFWQTHLDQFARKLLLALHYQCFGAALPSEGAIWHWIHTNYDFAAGRFPDEVLRLAENTAIPARQKSPMGDQFGIRWNVIPGKRTGLFVCHFHSRLAVSGVTTDTPEEFKSAWTKTPMRPYKHL